MFLVVCGFSQVVLRLVSSVWVTSCRLKFPEPDAWIRLCFFREIMAGLLNARIDVCRSLILVLVPFMARFDCHFFLGVHAADESSVTNCTSGSHDKHHQQGRHG